METVPDYRPKDIIIEKNQKTTTNQSTKFHQLQQMFGNLTSGNEVTEDIPLYKQINSIGDNINTENEVSKVLVRFFHKSFRLFIESGLFCQFVWGFFDRFSQRNHKKSPILIAVAFFWIKNVQIINAWSHLL